MTLKIYEKERKGIAKPSTIEDKIHIMTAGLGLENLQKQELKNSIRHLLKAQHLATIKEVMKKKISKKELYIRGLSKEAIMWVFKK